MSEETWSDEELAQQKVSTFDSVSIVETIRAVTEADRTEDEVNTLSRNERHIQLKMAITQFVSGLSVDEKAKIDALKLQYEKVFCRNKKKI